MAKLKKVHTKKSVLKKSSEIARAIGIENESDIALMHYKSALSSIAAIGIERSGLTVNEIVKRSGVARSKVSAIKNGALSGMSCDLFLRVIAAAGVRLVLKLEKGP